MKLLTDQNMTTINSVTASGSAEGFPASNLLNYDPDLIWKADAFSSDVTLVLDLLAATPIDYIWLNNANFLSATLQANASNVWTSPSVSKNVTLAEDDAGVVKGFFDLSSTDYRYVRIVIPVQTLTDGGSVPSLGNIILGSVEDIRVSSWVPDVAQEFYSFQADGGSFVKASKGKARHVFSIAIVALTKAELDALPLKGWSQAVIFTDLGNVADSFLVYPPAARRPRVRSQIDCDIEFTLDERV